MSSYVQRLIAGIAAVAALLTAAAANAGCGGCGSYPQPHPVVYVAPPMPAPVRCSPCGAPVYYQPATNCSPCGIGYGRDYMVNQGPVYSGPGLIAPPLTYTPTRLSHGYSYISGRYESEPYYQTPYRYGGYRPAAAPRYAVDHRMHSRVVNVRSDLPAQRRGAKIIRARADVRILGPQRMDIRLYR